MDLISITIGTFRPKGLGLKLKIKNGKLLTKNVIKDGAGYLSGVRIGDIIYSVNNDVVDINTVDIINKIMKMRSEIKLEVQRPNRSKESNATGQNNSCSIESDLINSPMKPQSPVSSIDPVTPVIVNKILDSNYVMDDRIEFYLEPAPSQIIRKPAYNGPQRNMSCLESPKINVKLANKVTSIPIKEPTLTLKKKVNESMGDVVMAVSNMSQKSKFFAGAEVRDEPIGDSVCFSAPLAKRESVDQVSVAISMDTRPSSVQLCATQPTVSDVFLLEVSVKMLSFKEKIRKPIWKDFTIKNESLGVFFHCLDILEVQTMCNSTAIDPNFCGLSIYMDQWPSNNSISKFFLPLGEQPYSNEIEISVTMDAIHLLYEKHNVDFLIDITKMPEDKMSILYFFLHLKLELSEVKPVESKKKQRNKSVDNIKFELRKTKSRKILSEPIPSLMLRDLPQTSLIENVPLAVIISVSIIDKFGLKNEGMYRISGNQTTRKKLENVLNNEGTEKWSEYEEWGNLNAVASLLKGVLRDYSLVDRDTAIKLSMINLASVDASNKEQTYMDMVYHLRRHLCESDSRIDGIKGRPTSEIRCRLETFKFLIKHLHRVTQYCEHNKMSAENLAACFSLTIIEDIPYDETGEYQNSKKCDADKNLAQMVTFWISNADLICELLEESEEQRRYRKLLQFSENPDNQKRRDSLDAVDGDDHDISVELRPTIEYYTSKAFRPSLEHNNVSAVSVPEGRFDDDSTNLEDDTACNQPKIVGEGTQRIDLSYQLERKKMNEEIHLSKVFPLTSMRLSGSVKNVPLIIEVCIKIIEEYGLEIHDLYSIRSLEQHLNGIDETDPISWLEISNLSAWSNIYIVSRLLRRILGGFGLIKKEFWSDLSSQFSENLCEEAVVDILRSAVYHFRHDERPKIYDKTFGNSEEYLKERDEEIRNATLRFLLKHLKTSSSYMSSNWLAVCFEEALMEQESAGDDESIRNKRVQILEKLIDHCDWIFEWADRPPPDTLKTTMIDCLHEYLNKYSSEEPSMKVPNNTITQKKIDRENIRLLIGKCIVKSLISVQEFLNSQRTSDDISIHVKNVFLRSQKYSKMYYDNAFI